MMRSLKGIFKFKSDRIGLTDVSMKALTFKYGKIKNAPKTGARKETEFHNVNGEFDLENGKLESKSLSFITKENIHGKTNFVYKFGDKDINGILSLAYFDRFGKIDGFNVTFYGDVRKLKTKLGTHVVKRK